MRSYLQGVGTWRALEGIVLALAFLCLAAAGGGAQSHPDRYQVRILAGRGEAQVVISPGDGGPPAEKLFRSSDTDRTFRIEPGNSYFFPESLWDRFSGSRHGPFRIEVLAPQGEAVVASGDRVGREPFADEPFMVTTFAGEESDRGAGLYVVVRRADEQGEFPPAPPWAVDLLEPVLESLERRLGPLPRPRPRVVLVDFPRPLAKSFPGALILDRRLAARNGPPPASRVAILAHEAAHQWWGNVVRVKGPGRSALQEGFAEFMACHVVGDLLGLEAEKARWAALRDEYVLASEAMADAGASLLTQTGALRYGRALRYARSSWVIRMLEARVGEAAFRNTMQALIRAARPVGWNDLLETAGRTGHVDLTSFASGWLQGSGHPDPVLGVNPSSGQVELRNAGRGRGDFPVVVRCGEREPEDRFFMSVPPGESRSLPVDARDCRVDVDPDHLFLLGPRGPAAPPGLILGRAWGFPVVRRIAEGSAADRAGLAAGDLILEADGRPMDEKRVGDLLHLLSNHDAVRLKIRRGTQEEEVVFMRP